MTMIFLPGYISPVREPMTISSDELVYYYWEGSPTHDSAYEMMCDHNHVTIDEVNDDNYDIYQAMCSACATDIELVRLIADDPNAEFVEEK